MIHLLYLVRRSLRGRGIRWLRQLRQPKYAIGSAIGVGWVLLWTLGSMRRELGEFFFISIAEYVDEFVLLIRFGVAVGFALWVVVSWLMPFGRLGLPFREAELHILLPAPVSRRNLIQLALIRSQIPILLTATLFALITSDGSVGGISRSWLSLWLLLSIFEWHNRFRAMQYVRLRCLEKTAARRSMMIKLAVVGSFGAVLLVRLRHVGLELQQAMISLLDRGGASIDEILAALGGARQDPLLGFLLTPFLWIAGPLLPSDWPSFLMAAVPSLAILLVLHECIVRSRAPFEEPALKHAEVVKTRKARARGKRTRGRGPRQSVLYQLKSVGPAAAGLTWKNLMQVQRQSFTMLALFALLVAVLLTFGPATLGRGVWLYNVTLIFAGWGFFFAPLIAVIVGRNDMRGELGHIEMVRTWPLGATALVWAEVLSPAIVGAVVGLYSGIVAVGSITGGILATQWHGIETNLRLGPSGGNEVAMFLASAWPLVASATVLVSSLMNLATLLFPAWIGIGDLKPRGIAASGQSLLVASALALAMLFATIPGALLVALGVWIVAGTEVGFAMWQLPIASVLILVPYWIEAIVINRISAELWSDLDPSMEILEGGS